MSFWDTSALLAMVMEQEGANDLNSLEASQGIEGVWWGSRVEVMSAFGRALRRREVDEQAVAEMARRIEALTAAADEVEPLEAVRATACRLVRSHEIRAADALQLAAALVWADHRPAGIGFVCLDRRLRRAAAQEGFHVLPR